MNSPVASTSGDRRHELEHVDLLGLKASLVDYDSVVAFALDAAEARRSTAVAFLAAHGYVEAARHKAFRQLVNEFAVVAPDGHGVRLGVNWLYRVGLRDRVYGPESMLRLCAAAATRGVSVYLYGAQRKALEGTQAFLLSRLPELQIAGAEEHPTVDGPTEFRPYRELTSEEDAALVERINASGAGLVFIGLGCPRQERFVADHVGKIDAVMACVGAAFDFHAGLKPMAPRWMQRWALEWLYRMLSEPRRLGKRYVTTNSAFLYRLAKQTIARRRRRATDQFDFNELNTGRAAILEDSVPCES